MMKKYILLAAVMFSVMPMMAQETYENAKLIENDLNGTARYVGMGGALEALGADISTISTNPAGIGLMRKSSFSATMGMVAQQDAESFGSGHKTNVSFDQIGFVWNTRTSSTGYLNFAFNYHKSKNFNYILSAADQLQGASQNKLTYLKQSEGLLYPANSNGVPNFDNPYVQCNQLDYMYAPNINYDSNDNMWYYEDANNYQLDRSHTGYISEYDFNISGNWGQRVFLGLTIGVHDVHYHHFGEYVEYFPVNSPIHVVDERKITGVGGDVKLGVIFRPIEESPFRVGLSIATPTWYDLTTRNNTTMSDGGGSVSSSEDYDFKLYTPWKFGVSLGHTVDSYLALGASYEFSDYTHLDSRYVTGEHYDSWTDSYSEDSESDDVMNDHISSTLRGVHTLKFGAELKPMPELALRVGYNFVSPMYEKMGYKDGTLPSEGSYYSSATDFTNWRAINRFTCGVGFQIEKLNLSAAYQYSAQNGYFQPFMSYYAHDNAGNWLSNDPENNIANEVKVSNKRHQFIVTATYTF